MKNKNKQDDAVSLMPNDMHSVNIMKQRAEQLSKVEITQDTEQVFVNYIKFQLGNNELYGIPFQSVKEVINDFNMTPVPRTKEYIAGVMNWRGSLLTLIDLRKYFNINTTNNEQQQCTLVVESKDVIMGVLTNTIVGSDQYAPTALEPALLANGLIDKEMVIGLHQGITTIINIDEILHKINVEVPRRAS